MRPNPQFPADLVTFTEEILNGKFHFLCSKGLHKFSSLFIMKSLLNGKLVLEGVFTSPVSYLGKNIKQSI